MKNAGFSSFWEDIIFLGVIFWKYKPPRGAAGDETLVFGNPNFTKKSGLGKYLVDFFNDLLKISSKIGSVAALTFRCGSDGNGPEIDCI